MFNLVVKLKFCLHTTLNRIGGVKIQLLLFLTLALNVGECSDSHFSHFAPGRELQYPLNRSMGVGNGAHLDIL